MDLPTILVSMLVSVTAGFIPHEEARTPTVADSFPPTLTAVFQELGLAGYGEDDDCPPGYSCCKAAGLISSCEERCYTQTEGTCTSSGTILVGICQCVPPIFGA